MASDAAREAATTAFLHERELWRIDTGRSGWDVVRRPFVTKEMMERRIYWDPDPAFPRRQFGTLGEAEKLVDDLCLGAALDAYEAATEGADGNQEPGG